MNQPTLIATVAGVVLAVFVIGFPSLRHAVGSNAKHQWDILESNSDGAGAVAEVRAEDLKSMPLLGLATSASYRYAYAMIFDDPAADEPGQLGIIVSRPVEWWKPNEILVHEYELSVEAALEIMRQIGFVVLAGSSADDVRNRIFPFEILARE